MATTIRADIVWEGDGSTTVTEGLRVPLTWYKPGELSLESLDRELREALQEEDYLRAADLRDFINATPKK